MSLSNILRLSSSLSEMLSAFYEWLTTPLSDWFSQSNVVNMVADRFSVTRLILRYWISQSATISEFVNGIIMRTPLDLMTSSVVTFVCIFIIIKWLLS